MDSAGVYVHRAERADVLADALGGMLAVPAGDPFAPELVAVPAKGVERWLAQRLSHRLGAVTGDGICAGVAFSSVAAIVDGATCAATGVEPEDDPWRPARAVWPLMEVLDAGAGAPWCAPLAAHRGRRYALARRIAELFASYAAHRPEMIRGWAGADGGVEPDLAWQPELWRRLRERIGTPGPAERLVTACAALRDDPLLVDLPPRLSLFGPTRLAADELAVLAALGRHRAVHLWLPHPSPASWEALARGGPAPVPARADDTSAGRVRHPLLASLGRDVREMQLRLADAVPGLVDRHHPRADPPPTLLGRLQQDLRDDHPPDGTFVAAPGDRTVTVHACHGPDRQVEVLREVVLGLLAADPTLEPRDVLVMCPDIETFAPLISAGFGLGERSPGSHPAQALPVRLADRALRQVNPLLDVVGTLLELAGARLTAAQALDLLAADPVRRRFGLDADDLARLRELTVASGVRWGLDAAHRGPFKLEGYPQNTWAAGLDRLLLGVATPGDTHLGTALGLDEVAPGDTTRIGRLAEFVERLAGVLAELDGQRPLAAWTATLTEALELLTATAPADAWQAAQARAELADAARPGATVLLGPADVRALLDERLRGRPTRANFRTGTITVATLVPMRSVPHRVVCLLGLDDGVFPRAGVVDGDDALARRPLVGERDARGEDRQLLLDAVCAATDRLVVVYSGADARTGARRPPAVPLGELLDTIAAMTPGADTHPRSSAHTVDGVRGGPTVCASGGVDVVTRHPLQPFAAGNFSAGAPFSFDRTELAGARAAATGRVPAPPFVAAPLAPVPATTVLLDDLATFLEHPVKGFLRQRVGLSLFAGEDDPADALPVAPDALAQWAIGDRLLRDRLAGRPLDACRQAEWRRGELPPGALGHALLAQLIDDVEPLVATAEPYRVGDASDVDVDVELPGGLRLVGTVGGLHGAVAPAVEYSRLAAKHRIRAWVRLLALTAVTGRPWQAVTIGRGRRFGLQVATAGPVDPGAARERLAELVALRAEGLREPLPLPVGAAAVYARVAGASHDATGALAEAEREWATGRERADDAHERVWGRAAPAAAFTAAPGPPGGEPTRFGALALRLWRPLLGAEELVRR